MPGATAFIGGNAVLLKGSVSKGNRRGPCPRAGAASRGSRSCLKARITDISERACRTVELLDTPLARPCGRGVNFQLRVEDVDFRWVASRLRTRQLRPHLTRDDMTPVIRL